jgi:hypothetical protein
MFLSSFVAVYVLAKQLIASNQPYGGAFSSFYMAHNGRPNINMCFLVPNSSKTSPFAPLTLYDVSPFAREGSDIPRVRLSREQRLNPANPPATPKPDAKRHTCEGYWC